MTRKHGARMRKLRAIAKSGRLDREIAEAWDDAMPPAQPVRKTKAQQSELARSEREAR